MQNLEKILNEYKNSNLNADDVKNAVSEIFAKSENREGSELKEALKTKMGEIFALFRRENLLNANDLKNAMEGVNQAISAKKESELYAMICEQERLAKLIDKKRGEIKNALKISFEAAEETIKGEEFSGKDEILGLLNDAIMRETRMFEILRESALNAFLTTIEQGRDVGETAAQVAKQTTYVATIEGEFSKERILEIARKVVSAACEAANEGHIFSGELIEGAINGAREGVSKAIERLKERVKFAPDAEALRNDLRNLKNIDEDFVAMLKELENGFEGAAKNEIDKLLNTQLDTNLARLKRISDQASQTIKERIEELKEGAGAALVASANERLEALKNELNERAGKLKTNIEINEKFEAIKRDIAELEKKANEKFEEIKQMNIKDEAQKFSDRAYSAAKNLVAKIKGGEK